MYNLDLYLIHKYNLSKYYSIKYTVSSYPAFKSDTCGAIRTCRMTKGSRMSLPV